MISGKQLEWMHFVRLQYSKKVLSSFCIETSWWHQEKETLYCSQQEQALEKVKMSVLKSYRVDKNGKISYLYLPLDECGPAVFMISYFDRHYCGKCHLTYWLNTSEDNCT